MFGAAGVGGPIGRAFLLVGLVGALFGFVSCVMGMRQRDEKVLRLSLRFATLSALSAVGARWVLGNLRARGSRLRARLSLETLQRVDHGNTDLLS